MRIGLIARCDSTGLGIQAKEFYDHIPCKALVIDFSGMSPTPSFDSILKPNYNWYPGGTIVSWGNTHRPTGDIPKHVIQEFIKDLDIVVAMETPYDFNIFKMCKQQNVKTILQLNYEFLDFPSSYLPHPDLFLAPSRWHYDDIPGPKKYLPVPVNTKHFKPNASPVGHFTHNAGRPAIHDRNGTNSLLWSLIHVSKDIHLNFNSQQQARVKINNPAVRYTCDDTNKAHYSDNYKGGVLIMPRKYGGLCLPINEAIAAEMPVIAPRISPNDSWLPEEWLIEARHTFSFDAKKRIDVFEPDVYSLAAKIDQFCDPEFYHKAVERAREIKKLISWDALLPDYYETFNELLR